MAEFTAAEKLACIAREVVWRKKVYPNRVLTSRMSKDKARFEIECMESIAADYARITQKESLL